MPPLSTSQRLQRPPGRTPSCTEPYLAHQQCEWKPGDRCHLETGEPTSAASRFPCSSSPFWCRVGCLRRICGSWGAPKPRQVGTGRLISALARYLRTAGQSCSLRRKLQTGLLWGVSSPQPPHTGRTSRSLPRARLRNRSNRVPRAHPFLVGPASVPAQEDRPTGDRHGGRSYHVHAEVSGGMLPA